MAQKPAQDLTRGDVIRNLGRTFVVTETEHDNAKTVVLVYVVGHAPFAYDYGQEVRLA